MAITQKAEILMRRGLEKDFDPDQMTAGQWAVSLDKKYVRMCFSPGLCLRMATYEGFEADMEEVRAILEECQDIQTAVDAMAALVEQHKDDAAASATLSKSWARGETGVRTGEDSNNSKYFSDLANALVSEAQILLNQAQNIVSAATQGALIPAGTVAFENLPTNPITGALYNISNDFTTDSRFSEGAGVFYRAGANIYWTADGKWDVMIGTQVTGVKGSKESVYRVGNVNLTPANIGAPAVDDLAEVAFSGIYNDLDNKPTNIESANWIKGDNASLVGKTIAYLRSLLDEIASRSTGIVPAVSVLRVTGENIISLWNNENVTTAITVGTRYTFTLIATFSDNNYQSWLLSTYTNNQTYVVVKTNGVWGKIEKIALEKNIPTTPAEIGAASAGELTSCWKNHAFSVAGWYRIARVYSTGRDISCVISIKRTYNYHYGESHKVQLISTFVGGTILKSIYDKCDTKIITKIRVVRDSENYSSIDIYYDSNTKNGTTFIIDDSIVSASGDATPDRWEMLDIQAVPETATGETVLAELEFEANSWLGGSL